MPTSSRYSLFESIVPFTSEFLDVGDSHCIYLEQSGNPEGVPVLFLHGGPGAGTSGIHRRFFNPDFYRIIIFDQRGAGRSTPHAETHNNTTQHLLDDIEIIRTHLGVERWLVFGGSWGSTLALLYGQRMPERCLGLILRGIFLGSDAEVDWFLQGIAAKVPKGWAWLADHAPESARDHLQDAFYPLLMNDDPAIHMPIARAWAKFETACSAYPPGNPSTISISDQTALSLARLEAHYFHHHLFLRKDELLDGVKRLKGMPVTIVQGREDIICPPETARTLAQALNTARYYEIPDAGHSALDPAITSALIEATEDFRNQWAASFNPKPV